jgi:hypothetical protein
MPDVNQKIEDFLYDEIILDFTEKNIKNLGDWLKYYGESYDDILKISNSYYGKLTNNKIQNIDFDEKILINNIIVLYCIEMDVDKPEGDLLKYIILTFIQIIQEYKLVILGKIKYFGEILISNKNSNKFLPV